MSSKSPPNSTQESNLSRRQDDVYPLIPAVVDVEALGAQNSSAAFYGGQDGGERGIRTLEGLLTLTPLAGVRLRPLGHLSGVRCAVRYENLIETRAGAKAGKNTGGNPQGKGLSGWRSGEVSGGPAGRGSGLLGHCRGSPLREADRQDPAPVSGRLTAPPAACSSRLMRS